MDNFNWESFNPKFEKTDFFLILSFFSSKFWNSEMWFEIWIVEIWIFKFIILKFEIQNLEILNSEIVINEILCFEILNSEIPKLLKKKRGGGRGQGQTPSEKFPWLKSETLSLLILKFWNYALMGSFWACF